MGAQVLHPFQISSKSSSGSGAVKMWNVDGWSLWQANSENYGSSHKQQIWPWRRGQRTMPMPQYGTVLVLKTFTFISYPILSYILRTASYIKLYPITVAAFRGMHVSPVKHSYAWLPRKCDYRTDRQTPDKVIHMCRYASQATQEYLRL